jgi:C4-dicarboxylate transporter, DctM subunit
MAGVPIESTVPWVLWFIVSFLVVIVLVFFQPELALWLPRRLGY